LLLYPDQFDYLYSADRDEQVLTAWAPPAKMAAGRIPASAVRPCRAGVDQRSVDVLTTATMCLKPSEMEEIPAGGMRTAG
jgi:hypothetical protein